MEQTNLVVTGDGKTWDEVTRDTSYIGDMVLQTTSNTAATASATIIYNDEWRGGGTTNFVQLFNKDFAIAYDRVICLVNGEYQIYTHNNSGKDDSRQSTIQVNGTTLLEGYKDTDNTQPNTATATITLSLKRGDYVQILGPQKGGGSYGILCSFEIRRM